MASKLTVFAVCSDQGRKDNKYSWRRELHEGLNGRVDHKGWESKAENL